MQKKELLAKIEPLFYGKTFKEVSLQDVATLLDIKKASLYYYFSSKEDMFLALIEHSFQKYLDFLEKLEKRWEKEDFQKLFLEFLYFWEKNKNIFSAINSRWYCEKLSILQFIQEKQKIIFETIYKAFSKKNNISREKTYLFLVIVNSYFKKDWVYWKCIIDDKKIPKEIENLFFN